RHLLVRQHDQRGSDHAPPAPTVHFVASQLPALQPQYAVRQLRASRLVRRRRGAARRRSECAAALVRTAEAAFYCRLMILMRPSPSTLAFFTSAMFSMPASRNWLSSSSLETDSLRMLRHKIAPSRTNVSGGGCMKRSKRGKWNDRRSSA